jgi:hypothetical protein
MLGTEVARWRLAPSYSREVRDVLFRVRPTILGSFRAEVGVEVSSYASVPRRSKWQSVDQQILDHFEVDEVWLAEKLKAARELAFRP